MSVRQLLGRIRWGAISALGRRDFPLPVSGPVVSFTFDDFPRSALHVGGSILKAHGARGTYYAAMGLIGQVNSLGEHFHAEDLHALLREGHELGSHTFDHVSGRARSRKDFEADVVKGKAAVERITGAGTAHHFSYPYGHATFRVKTGIGALMSSCRGIVPGINESPVDLNLLRANRLYSSTFQLKEIERLLAANEERRGWLIFYTHDVAEAPSPFGCTPREFESVVNLARRNSNQILPVGRVIGGIAESQQSNQPRVKSIEPEVRDLQRSCRVQRTIENGEPWLIPHGSPIRL